MKYKGYEISKQYHPGSDFRLSIDNVIIPKKPQFKDIDYFYAEKIETCVHCRNFIPEGDNNHSYCGYDGYGMSEKDKVCTYLDRITPRVDPANCATLIEMKQHIDKFDSIDRGE